MKSKEENSFTLARSESFGPDLSHICEREKEETRKATKFQSSFSNRHWNPEEKKKTGNKKTTTILRILEHEKKSKTWRKRSAQQLCAHSRGKKFPSIYTEIWDRISIQPWK